MLITFRIPGSLRKWFDGNDEAQCNGSDIRQCLNELEKQFPNINERLLDENGEVSTVLIFLNGDNIMKLSGLDTPVADGDEAAIIPLAAGG